MRSLHVLAVLLIFAATAAAQDAAGYAELPRFQKVNERLYRGGQPAQGGVSRLRELGINTIINLRGAGKITRAEEVEAQALGLTFVNVPLPNWGRPQNDRVNRILEILAAPEYGRVFVHCKEGVDRTGMIVAIYRMKHEGWTSTDALAEAERNGMRRIQIWMRDYVEDYGERVVKERTDTAVNSPGVNQDFRDRLGVSMRFLEKGAFRSRKVISRFFRKFSAPLH